MIIFKFLLMLACLALAVYDIAVIFFGAGWGLTGQKAGYELFGTLILAVQIEMSMSLEVISDKECNHVE